MAPRSREDKDIRNEIAYLEKNQHRMRYDHCADQGLFIGSGMVEAGCRHVIGQRFKQSGMFWTEQGANAIIGLRCCIKSDRIEDFWAYRACKTPTVKAAA